jgi:hypothetical protein
MEEQTNYVPFVNYQNTSDTTPVKDNKDPWSNRSDGMKCKTCIYFVPKQSKNKDYYDLGRCRRNAPTMKGFPVVFVNDWCGDHRIDEDKI